LRKRRPASAATESVRAAAAAATESVRAAAASDLHCSKPVLQRGTEYSAAVAAANVVHSAFASGSKRAVAEEWRIGVTTMQLRLQSIGSVRDAVVSTQPVDWKSGTVCVVGAGSLCPAASYLERRVARTSIWGHHGHAAVQYQLHAIFAFWWNRGVQRWHMGCVNSVQQPNRHTVHHSGAMRTECTTRAAAMLGAPADDSERRVGSRATRRGSDSAMQQRLRAERRCITDRVPPWFVLSAGRVGPISCDMRSTVESVRAAAPHWTDVRRDAPCRAKRQMDGPGGYRHAAVQSIVHWDRHRAMRERRVGNESI
jgi:hypothetical protein